jgi:hypothetical protein
LTMTKLAKERLEAEGWEFMGHISWDSREDVISKHMDALQGDTRFVFSLHAPLPNERRHDLYSVWKKRREAAGATNVHE